MAGSQTSLGYKTVAARAGDLLELFGIGFGPTNPMVLGWEGLYGRRSDHESSKFVHQ
jgi:hypothetical protein